MTLAIITENIINPHKTTRFYSLSIHMVINTLCTFMRFVSLYVMYIKSTSTTGPSISNKSVPVYAAFSTICNYNIPQFSIKITKI